jgi:large subunit ribosomal protein L21
MYAVIRAGGKQHRVKSGDVIEVELVHGGDGETVEFKPLLVVDDDGKTHHGKDVAKAVVVARLAGEQKGDKVKVFKYRPKTRYQRRQGHRQLMTLLEIEDVRLEGKRTPVKKDASEPSEKQPEKKPEKEPTKTTTRSSRSTKTAE